VANDATAFPVCGRFAAVLVCGKRAATVTKVIAGPGVYICNECVDLCMEIIDKGTTAAP
jgi:hypothetical protein